MADWREDNPAGRLHALLTQIRKVDGAQSIERTLVYVLDVEGGYGHVLFRRIADMVDLVRHAEEAVRQIDDVNHDLHLRWVEPANKLMNWAGQLPAASQHMQSCFEEAHFWSLEHCADLLHRQATETVLESESIDGLISLVREAIDAILGDEDMPVALRLHLVARLRDVEMALQGVRITGYAGVQQAMEAFTGAVVMAPEARASEPTKRWWERIRDAISAASSSAKEISEGAESVMKAIESVSGGG